MAKKKTSTKKKQASSKIDMASLKKSIEKPKEKRESSFKEKTVVKKKEEMKGKDPEKKQTKSSGFDMSALKASIESELKGHHNQISAQRGPVEDTLERAQDTKKKLSDDFIWTGIEGLDQLLKKGIPQGSNIIIAGGAGSGKTIMTMQILQYQASQGKKGIYMSFEESESRLRSHMRDFGWEPEKWEKKGNLIIQRFSTFDITRSVDALLMKAKGELLIDIDPVIIPKSFKPDFIVVDSLTAIDSAFTGKDESYRIYIEQLFRFFEKLGATAFLITETEQIPTVYSQNGVEEFLADGVIVLYNLARGNVRENAIEILKLRGAKHEKKIVAMQITDDGVVVYPEQEIFGGISKNRFD